MNRTRPIAIALLTLFIPLLANGQEVVTGLRSNPLISGQIPKTRASVTDTLELPFIDDFSYDGVYPDEGRWADRFVYINNSYSNKQVSTGVATFDIIDDHGEMYDAASVYGFDADKLTSLPINLDYVAADSIGFSFLYEAGGLGDMPETADNLILQFYSPVEERWEEVWENDKVETDGFETVTIMVKADKFLAKGFRFRFMNRASLGNVTTDPSMVGNCDHWNIDWVRLDKNRGINDTVITDVAFRFPNRSLLKTYEAIPWKQYKEIYLQEMGTTFTVSYRNNDTITRNVTREFEITDIYNNNVVKTFSGGATNIAPLSDVDYGAAHFYTFSPNNRDSALFKIKSWLKTDDFDRKENDTITYFQYFTDYYAYDDGTAENGYGINGLGSSNAMVSMRFRSYLPDTIYGVELYFNDSYNDENRTEFSLVIWDDNAGLPGNVLYEFEGCLVMRGEAVNGFHTYKLPSPVPVDGVFHVGWKQENELFMNVGLDANTPNQGRQQFWINGNWATSQVAGSIMIRPIVGFPIITSVSETGYTNESSKVGLWPNPARDHFYIDTEGYRVGSDYLAITDLSGVVVYKTTLTEYVDISGLKAGFYIVTISRNNKQLAYSRLIKIQ